MPCSSSCKGRASWEFSVPILTDSLQLTNRTKEFGARFLTFTANLECLIFVCYLATKGLCINAYVLLHLLPEKVVVQNSLLWGWALITWNGCNSPIWTRSWARHFWTRALSWLKNIQCETFQVIVTSLHSSMPPSPHNYVWWSVSFSICSNHDCSLIFNHWIFAIFSEV